MAEPTRHVAVTLIAATDEPAHQVMAGMLDAVLIARTLADAVHRARRPDPEEYETHA